MREMRQEWDVEERDTRGVARIAVAVRRENGRNRRAGVERDINSFRLEQTPRTYEPDVTSGDAEVSAP